MLEAEGAVGFRRDNRPHATAWLAPFPPALVKYEDEVIVSPASGKRGVTETMSAFREPMTRIVGAMVVVAIDYKEGLERSVCCICRSLTGGNAG